MKKTFEIKGIDLISLYGISDQNITFIEQYLPVNINSNFGGFFFIIARISFSFNNLVFSIKLDFTVSII